MQETIEYCKKAVAPERLKGFMMASWARTQRSDEAVLKESVDIIGKCISAQS